MMEGERYWINIGGKKIIEVDRNRTAITRADTKDYVEIPAMAIDRVLRNNVSKLTIEFNNNGIIEKYETTIGNYVTNSTPILTDFEITPKNKMTLVSLYCKKKTLPTFSAGHTQTTLQ